MKVELDRCKKKLQYFADEKSNLRRQIAEKSKKRSATSETYHHNHQVETKPSNPWYISKQNTRPGFSQQQQRQSTSSVGTLPARRFQYKVSGGGGSTVKPGSRKRPATDEMYIGDDVTPNSSQEQCGGKGFDFDVDVSFFIFFALIRFT